ncbi:uncharacterized protein LOC135397301 isoform X2 [Ornithodoros turicata]
MAAASRLRPAAHKVLRVCCILVLLFSVLFSAYYVLSVHFTPPPEKVVFPNETTQLVENRIRFFNRRLSSSLAKRYKNATLADDAGEDTWTGVLPGVHVYSAYVEQRNGAPWSDVRLIGIVARSNPILSKKKEGLKCRVRVRSRVHVGRVEFSLVPEDHGFQFTAVFILCMLERAFDPDCCPGVEVALKYQAYPLTWISVHQPRVNEGEDVVSVCVRPLFGPYDNLLQLAEFITYYSVVGVKDYSFYSYQVSREVDHFFRFLRERHKVVAHLRPWNFPVGSGLIHEQGQLAFVQDCIYRARLSSKYVVIVDLDEFIVAKHHKTLPDAILALEQKYSPKTTGSFNVINQMFCLEYTPETSLIYRGIPLLTRLYTIREKRAWQHWDRSKYIARTNATVTGGIHFVWKHAPEAKEIRLPEEDVVMHHYRRCSGLTQVGGKFLNFREFSVLQDGGQVDDIEMTRFTMDMLDHDITRSLVELMENDV